MALALDGLNFQALRPDVHDYKYVRIKVGFFVSIGNEFASMLPMPVCAIEH